MELQSQLFSGNAQLQAAAVLDAAHIAPGAAGEHVKKIQLALNQLDRVRLVPDGRYGSKTAAAVMAYKQQRGIVNRSFQTTADNIVGKMTIVALDREIRAQDSRPSALQALNPPPITPRAPIATNTPTLAVSAPPAGGTAPMIDLVPAPVFKQVVIPRNRVGVVEARNFVGGTLILSEPDRQNAHTKIAKLITGTNLRTSPQLDNVDIVVDAEAFRYQTNSLVCGIVKLQGVLGSKRSAILDVLVLVDKSSYTDEPEHPVDSTYASGLVSVKGTPLKPLGGRRINIFGRGESNGFENYSTSIPFCNDSGQQTKPWTNDPRKPGIGIDDKSVKNICIRSSPIKQVTIDEIKRIAAPKCRVTYVEPDDTDFTKLMRREFLDSGIARKPPIEDGPGKFGFALVFEFQ